MLIPAVSVLAAITLLPALLAVLGTRINSLRLLPKRFVDHGHPEEGCVGRWARLRHAPSRSGRRGRAWSSSACSSSSALSLTRARRRPKDLPGSGDAIAGRTALAAPASRPGVMKPFVVLVEHGASPQPSSSSCARRAGVAGGRRPARLAHGSRQRSSRRSRPSTARRGATKATIERVQSGARGARTRTLGGLAAEDRDFVHAVYGNFPYVLALRRAAHLRPAGPRLPLALLPLKAVILNLVSLTAAFGIIVFIFQEGTARTRSGTSTRPPRSSPGSR